MDGEKEAPVEVAEQQDSGSAKKRGPKPKNGVSREEFDELKSRIVQGFQSVPTSSVAAMPPADGATDKMTAVPQSWNQLRDEILGPEFDIELELPENGGQRFVIHVPREKSNAGKDHWAMHKRDKRTRELGNTGVKGVKDWLLKVRKNLIGSGIRLPYYEDTEPRMVSTR